MLKPDYWFEGIDGTRLGEVRSAGKGYRVYDTQNQLKATVRPASGQRWKSPWLIEDSEGRQLGEIKQSSRFLREYHVLGQDGKFIAMIHPIISLSLLHTELTSCAEVWIPT